MGSSGLILQKSEDIDIDKSIKNTIIAAKNAGLEIHISKKMNSSISNETYVLASLANHFDINNDEPQMVMYIFDYRDRDWLDEFDYIRKGGHLVHSVNIEDISGCEKILLDFLYEFMKLTPDVIFWDEDGFFYDYNDIIQIFKNDFDECWCYKK